MDFKIQICEHFEAPGDALSQLWSFQVDKSTDISGKVQLLAFIQFIKDAQFLNEYLFCKDMKTTMTGKYIFKLVNENILLFKLQWGKMYQRLHRWMSFEAGK